MKKIILFFIIITSTLHLNAQVKETISQNRADQIGLKSKKFFVKQAWYNPSFNAYPLNKKAIKKLKKYTHTFKIKAFMAVWCHDSKREVPRLYKILEAIDFDLENLEVIAVNRAKKTPNNLQEGFNITKTPTFIFFKNDKELGRYVEVPVKSLEKDMLRIVSGKTYKHASKKE